MLIAQITDSHIGFKGPDGQDPNLPRLRDVFTHIKSLLKQPDLVILSGDLTESGANEDYKTLQNELDGCPWPVFLAMGNHDLRGPYSEVFGREDLNDGFCQYVFEQGEYNIIVLDTLLDGKHRGGFCERRAKWLDKTLSQAPQKPTIIVLHHPPVPIQIPWMSMPDSAEWAERLKSVVEKHTQIIHYMAGHVHRPISAQFCNRLLSVAPAIASQTALELAELDPQTPDNRPMIIDSPAGYALHNYSSRDVVSHFGYVPEGKVLVRYDERFHWLPKMTMDMT